MWKSISSEGGLLSVLLHSPLVAGADKAKCRVLGLMLNRCYTKKLKPLYRVYSFTVKVLTPH